MKNQRVYKMVESAGNHHRYQYLLFIIVFFIYGSSEFITISIPYVEIRPEIIENNKTIDLTYKICEKYEKENKKMNLIFPKTTLVSDFDIYCDKGKTAFIGTSTFIGILLGSLCNMPLADNLGRKKTMIFAGIIYILAIFSISFIRNYYLLVVILATTGFSYIILALSSFMMMNEAIKTELVSIFSSLIYSAYDLFGVIYPLFFYLYTKWWYLYITVGCFFVVVYIIFILYTVESPLYLYSKGKMEEFKATLEIIQKKNKIQANESILIQTLNENNTPEDEENDIKNKKQYSVLDLLRLKSQRWNFITISLIWLVCSFIYYGVTFNIKNLSGNVYFRGIQMNLIEIVVVVLSGFIANIKFMGRTRTIKAFFSLSFAAFFALIFINPQSDAYFYLLVVGRFSLSSVFSIIYYVSNEIYPTPIRAKGLSMNSLVSRFGGIIAPYVIDFMEFKYTLILFCGLVFISFGLSFILEETLGRSMKSYVPEDEDNTN